MSLERRAEEGSATMNARVVVRRIGFYVFVALVTAFFALPMLWLVTAPFSKNPTFSVRWPDFTLANFSALTESTDALPSLYNSAVVKASRSRVSTPI